MVADKTRIGPGLKQDDGFFVRETLLRVEPTIDLYIREKWEEGEESKEVL